MDVLACPICKGFPLDLVTFRTGKARTESAVAVVHCEYYCGYRRSLIDDDSTYDCDLCVSVDITEGILLCHGCKRWYRISDALPVLLPDHLRDKDKDISFLLEHRSEIDREVLEAWLPVHL